MIPISEKNRLVAALQVARDLHEHPDKADSYPTGTVLTPVGTDEGSLLVAVGSPEGKTEDSFRRVASPA